MFGDNDQSQKPADNNDNSGQVNSPADPIKHSDISSFNMGPALTPSKAAAIEPPAPPPPLPDINSIEKADSNLPLTLPSPHTSDDSKADDSSAVDEPASKPAKTDDNSSSSDSSDDDSLLNIKQQALNQLTPMLKHLDQTPEEKFRTYMMMIQANDDKSLINSAYEAAQQITDEKSKAQALLDVVNEINYFTRNENDSDSEED
jgi:hypothetical protein